MPAEHRSNRIKQSPGTCPELAVQPPGTAFLRSRTRSLPRRHCLQRFLIPCIQREDDSSRAVIDFPSEAYLPSNNARNFLNAWLSLLRVVRLNACGPKLIISTLQAFLWPA